MNWREWTYADWNAALLRHAFGASTKWRKDPVERIQASPDELLLVVKDPTADSKIVVDAFVDCAKANVPRGGATFSRYCYSYGDWTPTSEAPPHFFGMLWLTCLAAYGHPDPRLTFYPRIRALLGKADNLQRHQGETAQICLPPLWSDLQTWLSIRCGKGDLYRPLSLPPDVGRRTGIGQSWFLTFPHSEDRSKLARALWEEGLVGFEPPVQKVLELLGARRREFSRGFNEDLEDFRSAYAAGSVSAKASAFWRAVRQESLSPCVTREGTRRSSEDRVELVVSDTQEGFQPLVCGTEGWTVEHYTTRALPEPVDELTTYLRGIDDSLDEPAEDAIVYGNLLSLKHRQLVREGILLLREYSSVLYSVVSGSEAHGVTTALVRNDLVAPFRAAFGGVLGEVLLDGWSAVTGCAVRISEEPPPGLARISQLLPTMYPRVISSSGGIRVGSAFLRALHFVPHLHANGATSVVVRKHDGGEVPCTPVQHDGRVEWELPREEVPRGGELLVRATWPARDSASAEVAETCLRFEEEASALAYKPLASGYYGLEACIEPELQVAGGVEVGLGVTTNCSDASADLFDLETQIRYLGPGLGEMSDEPRPQFDWFTLGPFKNPDALVFVGDPAHPVMPTNVQADHKGARRHWREAFHNAKQVFVRTAEGAYRALADYPEVSRALGSYKRHVSVPAGAATCQTIASAALDEAANGQPQPDAVTEEAVAVLAALSARKAGLSHKEVSEILGALLPRAPESRGHEFLAIQQLVRAWSEAGQVDVVRELRGGHLSIVARRPRLVFVRRGPSVEARLLGLLNPDVRRRLEGLAKRFDVTIAEDLRAANKWQPSVPRLRGSAAVLNALAQEAEFEPSEWLHWPSLTSVPDHSNVTAAYGAIKPDLATPAFKARSAWDWNERRFSRDALGHPGVGDVKLERRLHPDGSSVHVVLERGTPVASSYLRNWALLFAYDLAGHRPFTQTAGGILECTGSSPVHLPLPIARVCALTGTGLPGPRFDARGAVVSYEYPLGKRLLEILEPVIPKDWIAR